MDVANRQRILAWHGSSRIVAVIFSIPSLIVLVALGGAANDEGDQPAMDSVRLHHRDEGDGERQLLVLHGLIGASGYFANRLGDMAADHRVLAPDLLGFGASPKPRDASYDLDQHVDVLLATLGPQLEGRKTLVVGHSFGAIVTLALINRRPDLFTGAVLISVPVFSGRKEGAEWARRLGPMQAGIIDNSGLVRMVCESRALFRVPAAATLFGLPKDVYLDASRHTWHSMAGTLRHVIDVDVELLARQTRLPLLFIHGSSDETAPAKRAVELATAVYADLVVMAGDHQVFLGDPNRVWRSIRTFEDKALSTASRGLATAIRAKLPSAASVEP